MTTPEKDFQQKLIDFAKDKCPEKKENCPIKNLFKASSKKSFETAYEAAFGKNVKNKGCNKKGCKLQASFDRFISKYSESADRADKLLNIRQNVARKLFIENL